MTEWAEKKPALRTQRVLQFTPRPGATITGSGAQANPFQPVLVAEASLSVMGVSQEQMNILLARAGAKRTNSTRKLLWRFWTRPFTEIRRSVTALLAAVAAQTDVWLAYLDRINETSPHLLSLFGHMLNSYGWTLNPAADERDPAELAVLARHFLEEHGGLGYRVLRPRLLAFCLYELIHPDLIAELARSQVVVLPEARLNKLVNDWPLRHVYRACALFRM